MSSFADLYRGIAVEPATTSTIQALKEEGKLDCPICHLPFVELQQFFPKRPINTAHVGLIATGLIVPFIDQPKEPTPQDPINVLAVMHRCTARTNPITLKACNHTFCSSCLTDWLYFNLLVGRNTCPCCHASLTIPKPGGIRELANSTGHEHGSFTATRASGPCSRRKGTYHRQIATLCCAGDASGRSLIAKGTGQLHDLHAGRLF